MSNTGKRVAVELRLPVALGTDAIRERALGLEQAGFRWDASSTLPTPATGRDETVLLQGWSDSDGLALLKNEPDVLAVWAVENEWWDKLIIDNRKH